MSCAVDRMGWHIYDASRESWAFTFQLISRSLRLCVGCTGMKRCMADWSGFVHSVLTYSTLLLRSVQIRCDPLRWISPVLNLRPTDWKRCVPLSRHTSWSSLTAPPRLIVLF